MIVHGWEMRRANEPLVSAQWDLETIESGHVAVQVAACGVCRTDLKHMLDGIPPTCPPPHTLGHEISGTVVEAGDDATEWLGRAVVVPPIIPCGRCHPCHSGHARTCAHQTILGRDIRGGFASHVVVPARGLCAVDAAELETSSVPLANLAVLAEAVAIPYQAMVRSRLREGEIAIFVGVGGIGGFGTQIATALGAHVVALDIVDERLEQALGFGASQALNVAGRDPDSVRRAIQDYTRAHGLRHCWKIYETSGTAAGQEMAFRLLTHGACLTVIGHACEDVTVRLSNLAKLDATALGSQGCLSKHLPGALDLILAGDVKIEPLVERRPMSHINDTLEQLRTQRITRRPILIPDFDNGVSAA